MYAVIKTGGKQYRVAKGQRIKVETLPAEVGSTVNFQALMIADGDQLYIGTPALAGSNITATVIQHGRGEKIKIVKFRRRKHYRKQMGHRQNFTEVEIQNIAN